MHTPYGTCIHGPVLNHIRIMKHHNYAMSVASVHARYQVRKIEVTTQVKSSPQDRSDKSSRVRTSCEHLPKHWNPAHGGRRGQRPGSCMRSLELIQTHWNATGSVHVLPCEVLNLAPLRYIRSFTLFMCWVRGRTAADHLRHGGVTLSAFCPSIL